jgi:hypothetical protein
LNGVFAHLLEEQSRYHIERDDDDDDATLVVRSVHPQARKALARITGALPHITGALPPVPLAHEVLSWSDILSDALDEDARTSEHAIALPSIKNLASILTTQKMPAVPETPVPSGNSFPPSQPQKEKQDGDPPGNSFPPSQPQKEKQDGDPLRASVHITVDDQQVMTYQLGSPAMIIGRKSSSNIQIPSPRISRYHAVLLWKHGSWSIEDLDSLNGITWEGERIRQKVLANGDRIYLDANIVCQYQEE